MKRFILLACFLSVGVTANAYNVTIDFEELPIDGDTTPGNDPIVSQGFEFSGLLEKGITDWPLGTQDDSKALHWCANSCFQYPGSSVRMTQQGNNSFDLVSLELAAQSTFPTVFELTGLIAGGGTVFTLLTVNSQTLTPFVLGAGWENLEALIINPQQVDIAVAVDNIVLTNVVPIPGAVWLFGSALAGLGWSRRKSATL